LQGGTWFLFDAYAEAARKFDPKRGCEFSTYARRYVQHRIQSEIRLFAQWIPASIDPRSVISLSSSIDIVDPRPGPEEIVIAQYTTDAIRDAVCRLPDKFGLVMQMKMGEVPLDTIGDVLSLAHGTVKSRLSYGRKILRDRNPDLFD
jgi:RNA polymerase sigma factor (sigma-70 family)